MMNLGSNWKWSETLLHDDTLRERWGETGSWWGDPAGSGAKFMVWSNLYLDHLQERILTSWLVRAQKSSRYVWWIEKPAEYKRTLMPPPPLGTNGAECRIEFRTPGLAYWNLASNYLFNLSIASSFTCGQSCGLHSEVTGNPQVIWSSSWNIQLLKELNEWSPFLVT